MKKDEESIFTGVILGVFLYFVGAIDFSNPISYVLILSLGIIIGLPLYNIMKKIFFNLFKH